MNIVEKVKLWWKSTPLKDKILYAVSGVSVVASAASIATCVHMKNSVDNVKIDVKLYPGGKEDPNPVDLTPANDAVPVPEPLVEKIPANTDTDKWDVWNPEWEPKYKSADGYEATRLFDALDVLQKFDNGEMSVDEFEDCLAESQARVEDLARQFAYLEDRQDEFRKRFPYLKNYVDDVYENIQPEEKKGE